MKIPNLFLDTINPIKLRALDKYIQVLYQANAPRSALCCYVHLYYDRFSDIEKYIRETDMGYDFIFSVVRGSPAEAQSGPLLQFAREHRRCNVLLVPNSGSDVIAFLLMLHRRDFEGYEFVCKLHGKMTNRHPELGQWWFDTMFKETLVDGLRVLRTALSCGIRPSLVGARSLIITEPAFWNDNVRNARRLGSLLGMNLSVMPTPFFFAGTAFWISERLLRSLDGLIDYKFRRSDLLYEADGGFGHAFERVLPLKALSMGGGVLDSSGTQYSAGFIKSGLVHDKFRSQFLD